MRGRTWQGFALLTVAALGLGACGGGGANGDVQEGSAASEPGQPQAAAPAQPAAALAPGVTQEQFDMGQQLFTGEAACQACHGPDARGTQLAPNLRDAEWINIPEPTVDHIAQLIRTGVQQPKQHPAPMPAMGGANLSDEQVRALAAYVASIGQAQS